MKFKDSELYKQQGKDAVMLGGRLRVGHEQWAEKMSVRTQLITHTESETIVRAVVDSPKGKFSAHGKADQKSDPTMRDSLVELAESRAVGRALRYAGIGVEFVGSEELGRNTDSRPGIVKQARVEVAVPVVRDTILNQAADLLSRLNPVQRSIVWRRMNLESPVEIAKLTPEELARVIAECRKLVE